jgi:hypothetical protein
MAEFKHEGLDCSFTLPDPFTLGDVEKWRAGTDLALQSGAKTELATRWLAAREIITDWECEALPDVMMESDEISGEQLRVIAWVGAEVQRHVLLLLTVPKN